MPITFIPSAVGDELNIVGQKQIDTGNKRNHLKNGLN